MSISKKSFFGAAFGTLVEYYDSALVTIFLPILSPLFFPADSIYHSLVKGYFFLLITLLARPLGGIFFGYLGDVLGRRKALLISMYGIAASTLVIGILPPYSTWGVWVIILLTTSKSVQMLCFGGEYSGAGVYVVEHAKNKNEAFIAGLLTAIMMAGSLVASLLGIWVTNPSMPSWSWRLAFIFGSLIGIFAIFYRKELLETPVFKPANLHLQNFKMLLKQYPKELFAGFCIGGFATMPYTTVLTFINPVLMTKGVITAQQLMQTQSLIILIAILALIISGRCADRLSPRKVMQWGCLFLILIAWPGLFLIDHHQLTFFALSLMIIANEMLLAPANAYLKNLFDVEYRYRGIAFSFCLGMSVIGGLTPLVENFLYAKFGNFQSILWWIILISGVTWVAMHYNRSREANELTRLQYATMKAEGKEHIEIYIE